MQCLLPLMRATPVQPDLFSVQARVTDPTKALPLVVCFADLRRFIFSGALVPKQIKCLLKMKGLAAVVTRDAESVVAMEEAMDAVSSVRTGCVGVANFPHIGQIG